MTPTYGGRSKKLVIIGGSLMEYRNKGKIKKAVIYGDSISTRNHGNGGYEVLLQETMGIAKIINHAISGSGLANITPDSTSELLTKEENIHEDVDLILLWHGTNDWYWGSEIGNLDMGKDTYLGALDFAVNTLRKASPKANIISFTPLFRYEKPDGCHEIGDGYHTKNKRGYTLGHYYDGLKRAGVELGFPVVDLRVWTNFHMKNAFLYFEDMVHPNGAGYKKINEIICAHLDFISFC